MEELKKIIQAIVISNAGCPMTILQLDSDFKCHEGYNIPYEKHGFQHLDAMLRSMSDAVQTKGQGSSALVLPVITQKSKHIRQMVVKQKQNGKKRKIEPSRCTVKKGKFESFDCPRTNASNDVVISRANHNFQTRLGNGSNSVVDKFCLALAELKQMIKAMVLSKPGSSLTVAQLAKDFKHHEGMDIPYRDYGFQQLDALLRSIPDVVKLVGLGSSALVYPVTSEKSKHIEAMIKAQKNNSKRCYNRTAYSSRIIGLSSKRGSNLNNHSSNLYGNGHHSYSAKRNHSANPSYATHGFNSNKNLRYGNNVISHSYAPITYPTNYHNAHRYPRHGYTVPGEPYALIGNATKVRSTDRNLGNDYNGRNNVNAPNSYSVKTNLRHDGNLPGQSYACNGYNANRNRGSHDSVPDNSYAPNDLHANSNPGKDNTSTSNCCSVTSVQNLGNGNSAPIFSPALITNPERRFLKLLYEVLVEKSLKKESSFP